MTSLRSLLGFDTLAPVAGLVGLALVYGGSGAVPIALVAAIVFVNVLAAVYHAEVIAHRVGEPFGTFLFALAVTVIEAGLIVSIMASDPLANAALARDTVMAAIMIILNGVVGACLLLGGIRHGEQIYRQSGVSAALATLAALSVIILILPNHVVSRPGPTYVPSQLAMIGMVSLILYLTFVLVQTVRHRNYFLPKADALVEDDEEHVDLPGTQQTFASAGLLIASLFAVVFLAKAMAPQVEASILALGAPIALVGIVIAALVLLPEGVAAVRAARSNRLQTSLNLALGSALATIGLTIPVVAAIAIASDWTLTLGVGGVNQVLLALTLLVSTLSLSTGRTTIMQGVLHLVLFTVYIFLTIVP